MKKDSLFGYSIPFHKSCEKGAQGSQLLHGGLFIKEVSRKSNSDGSHIHFLASRMPTRFIIRMEMDNLTSLTYQVVVGDAVAIFQRESTVAVGTIDGFQLHFFRARRVMQDNRIGGAPYSPRTKGSLKSSLQR